MPGAPPTPVCRHCGAPAETQWQRHATDAEYAALEGTGLAPVDGYAVVAEFGCGDHTPEPFCDHAPPPPAPCPVCAAGPGASCTKPDGTARPVEHRERAEAQPGPETCRHAHRPDCAGYGQCRCTAHDPAPDRTGYPAPPVVPAAARAAALQKIQDAEIAWYARLLRENGMDRGEAQRTAHEAFGRHMAAALAAAAATVQAAEET